MEYDFMKRGYLLPDGCKDLFDALKLKARSASGRSLPPPALLSVAMPEVEVPDKLSVEQLARLLGEKPVEIVFDLIKLGIYTTVKEELDFVTISRVMRQYGFNAKKIL